MQTVKRNFILTALLFAGIMAGGATAQAQDREICEKIAVETVEAIKKQSFEQIEQYLTSDFSCAGQQGKIALMVLKQLSKQALDKISDYKKTGETLENDELTLVYEISTDKFGNKETNFVFNAQNQLKRLDFAGFTTKTMNSNDTKIEKSKDRIITVPVQIGTNNLLIAEAKINGVIKKFIIDNGAPGLILNSKHVNAIQDSVSKSVISSSKDVNGSVSGIDIIAISEFDFYGMTIKNQDALTKDLSSLEKTAEMEIGGLIGFQVFKEYDLLFDYENGTIVFIQPDFTSNYLENTYKGNKTVEIPIEMQQHIPSVKGTIGKQEFTFGIDCGAGGNLLNENYYGALKKHLKKVEDTYLKGVGEAKNVQTGQLKEIKIGDRTFKQTMTVFNDMKHLDMLKIDGLIGYEILSKQKTLLSFQNKKLVFLE